MKPTICPLDNRPCERNCPDRYRHDPAGGCYLTTVVEYGAQIIWAGGDDVVIMFNARQKSRCQRCEH